MFLHTKPLNSLLSKYYFTCCIQRYFLGQCPRQQFTGDGTFNSPNYGPSQFYPADGTCTWDITVQLGLVSSYNSILVMQKIRPQSLC